jgi:hypothetical protein
LNEEEEDEDDEEETVQVVTKKPKAKADFTAVWWTNELRGVQFRDDGDLWQITKVISTGGWKVDHFNTETKDKQQETFREILEIGLSGRQAWFKPEYKDFMVRKGWL